MDIAPLYSELSRFGLVIFDCDGVLVDSEVLSCACLAEMLCRHGYDIDLEGVFDAFLGRSFSVVSDRYAEATGRPLGPGFVAEHRALLMQRFAALTPVAGVERVLGDLRQPVCVASSSDSQRLAYTLSVSGLAPRFGAHVYSSDQVARGKPAPDLFDHAAAQMGVAANAALVIEDSVNGVRAGKAAGMTVWGYVGGSHHAGRDGAGVLTAAGADRVFDDMHDLVEPATAAPA